MDVLKYQIGLGKTIKTIRKQQMTTQEELAFEAKLNQNYVSDIENAKVNCSIRTLIRVVNALEVKPSTLFILAEDLLGKEGGE